MSDRPWWITVLQWTLWALAMVLVMRWLGKARFRKRSDHDARRLAHPASTLIIGLVCFGFFAGIAIVSNVIPNKTTTWWTTAVFVGFALMSVPMISDYFLARHEVTDEGLKYRTMFGASRYVRWADLQHVHYAPVMKWFRLQTNTGVVARVSVMLMGLPEFARLLLEHAPAGAIAPETLPVLQATADGYPPSLWA